MIARGDVAVARLVPLAAKEHRELGFPPLTVTEAFFDGLPEEELAAA